MSYLSLEAIERALPREVQARGCEATQGTLEWFGGRSFHAVFAAGPLEQGAEVEATAD